MNIEREKYAISYEKHLQDVKQEAENLEAKTFKKYEGYVSIYNFRLILFLQYFIMKEKRAKLKAKKKLENEKLQLKQERLRLLEEENEKQRKNIIKKLNKMEKKKLELDRRKDEFYQQIKEEQNMKVQGTKVNKNSLSKEADAKRDEILEYERYVFGLVKSKEAGNNNKKILSQNKTIQTQKNEQNRMKEFKKIINTLQDDSVTNKNDRQKRRMYNEKVRKDLEEKKKEEEKKLEEAGLL